MQCDEDTLSTYIFFSSFRYLFIAFCWQTKRRLAQNTFTPTDTWAARKIYWMITSYELDNTNSLMGEFIGRLCGGSYIFFSMFEESVILEDGGAFSWKYFKCAKYLFDKWSKEIDFYSFEYGLWFIICILISDSGRFWLITCYMRAIFVWNTTQQQQQQQLSVSRDVFDLWYFFFEWISTQINCMQLKMMARTVNTVIFLH